MAMGQIRFNPDKKGEFSEAQSKKLDKMSNIFLAKRQMAKDGRIKLNMEERWAQDTLSYQGVESYGRRGGGESAGDFTYFSGNKENLFDTLGNDDQRKQFSQVVLNITEPYTDSAAARLSDIVTKSDELPWSIKPTPVADLERAAQGNLGEETEEKIRGSIESEAGIAERASGEPQDVESMVEEERQMVIDEAKSMRIEANQKAEKAERRIRDWHHESHFLSELRKVIFDAAKLGTGVMKGPYPMMSKKMVYREGQLEEQVSVKPFSARVDPWNCFPDPTCGEDIHNGEYHFERDWISRSAVRKLVEQPHYFKSQIRKALKQGPDENSSDRGVDDKYQHLDSADPNASSNRFALWYCYTWLSLEDLEGIGGDLGMDIHVDKEKGDDLFREVPVLVTMLNDTIIGIVRNPMIDGSFPYDYFQWTEQSGIIWGKGIPRIIQTPQRICNAASRAMMDNAGRASGPMLVYDDSLIEPEFGDNVSIEPWMIYRKVASYGQMGQEGQAKSVQDAISVLNIPMYVKELQEIVYFSMDFSERVTGMPWILMGQQAGGESSGTTPQGTGTTRIMNENAGAALRAIGSRLDDRLIEPHVRRYYQWLLEHGEIDEEKGDLEVVAMGSISLVARETESAQLQVLAQYMGDPKFGLDPKKFMQEMMKSMNLDSSNLEYEDEEWKQIVEQMSAPPPDPAIEIAQMRMQGEMAKEEGRMVSKDKEIAANLIIEEWRRESALHVANMKREIDELNLVMKQAQLDGQTQIQLEGMKEKLMESLIKMETDLKVSEDRMNTPKAQSANA